MSVRLIEGDCLAELPKVAAAGAEVDAIVTDPPYHLHSGNASFDWDALAPGGSGGRLTGSVTPTNKAGRGHKSTGFMNRKWDGGDVAFRPETWAAMLPALKPGGYLLAFGGTRTHHRIWCAIEDAGFVIQDTIMWVYGCLSEDTELVTPSGVSQYYKAKAGDPVLCYDPATSEYSWQPIQEIYEYPVDDTVFRIRSDRTDQIVSRNHRCLVERGGAETFEFAETVASEREARVPVLEDLPGLLKALPGPYNRASEPKSDLFAQMQRGVDQSSEERENTPDRKAQGSGDPMRRLRHHEVETKRVVAQDLRSDMQRSMQRHSARRGLEGTRSQRSRGLVARGRSVIQRAYERIAKSSMEGWRYLSQATRQLCLGSLCPLPAGIPVDGTQGRLCDGASLGRSAGNWASAYEGRDGAPRQPQTTRQPTEQLDAVRDEPGSQTVRAWRGHHSDMARITPERYRGKIWCIRVATGCFVAVRNGKAFPTGNSGFPKGRTQLKPAFEPICVAYKPGGPRVLQIDECRTPTNGENMGDPARFIGVETHRTNGWDRPHKHDADEMLARKQAATIRSADLGRWPANLAHDGSDEVMEAFSAFGEKTSNSTGSGGCLREIGFRGSNGKPVSIGQYPQTAGSAARFFASLSPNDDELLIWRAKANMAEWNPELANTADNNSSLSKRAAGSALNDAVTWASRGASSLIESSCRGLSTSVTPHELRTLSESAITAILKSESASAPGSQHEKQYLNSSRANIAVVTTRTGITTITISHWRSDGSAAPVTFKCTPSSTEAGVPALAGTERFHYCAKASKADRAGSSHPTVKPIALMRWLVRLVTPVGGTILDPFAGSGTTGAAAMATGRNAILIEREPQYCSDIRARLAHYEGAGGHTLVSKARNRNVEPLGGLFAMDEAAE